MPDDLGSLDREVARRMQGTIMAPGNKAMEAIIRAYNARNPPMPGHEAIDMQIDELLHDIIDAEVPPVTLPVAVEGQHPYRGGYPSAEEPRGWLRAAWERLRVFFR